MIFSGTSPDGNLVEIVEIKEHPYFIAAQFHPEFKSRPDRPQPLFVGLIKMQKIECRKIESSYYSSSSTYSFVF